MTQIKKKHHYVWKEYLKSWSKANDQVFTYLKRTNEVKSINITGVAQQRFYYSLEEFTLEEEIILKEIVKKFSHESVVELNLEFYELFISYSKIKREIDLKIIPIEIKHELDNQLSLLKANSLEDTYSKIEDLGKKITAINRFDDIKFLDSDEDLFSTMTYLSFQYLRTKKMRNNLENSLKNHTYIIPKYLKLFPFIYSSKLARSLSFEKNVKFIYYENQSGEDFLTSDQPLINLLLNEKDVTGHVKYFKLYYPLNPQTAIVVHYNDKQKQKYLNVKVGKEKVISLNKMIIENAEEFIFAKTENQLMEYKNCL